MDFAKIVCHTERGHRMRVTCQLAGKFKPLARKASCKPSDAQIEAFYLAGANFVYIGSARSDFEFDASAFRVAMAIIRVNAEQNAFTRVFAVSLLHQGQSEAAKQLNADCRDTIRPTIASDLNHGGQARSQLCNKVIGVLIITLARQMRDHQLRALVNAWGHLDGKHDERTRFFAVLEIPSVESAETAVPVEIVKDLKLGCSND